MTVQQEAVAEGEALEVWIDQDLCTGDGICVQYAPEVFELDIDGLAYVKGSGDELLQAPGRQRPFRCRFSRMWWTPRRSVRRVHPCTSRFGQRRGVRS